ncbi:MAG TPA: sigma-70 family RNA polymerase sigma factor [Algoriphagus sp.]|jgi:RNA polymerase sigma-70 factor (ECF subfamily)|uniref:RNA polymerase sigma factor n=1 Tax=unclassified Algoriphagus TaxID=2641541 RepID=UPI000C35DE1D|nr:MULTISPECIES: sigma-70 family RNA polymerase sigma factor [unclassified Algoriphagus]MAL14562.1 RNA polymerase subunit sigma-70 [Algoriphagus sp.]MAN87477.1 RNA polymerase subunit sigma-70 [Algoriphagus sp.]QYH39300.1 sigma-70 family RNA polymerase sigma factor [Algoriphagus sp. NBT04N3]HAH35820.1 sigma-70 family RNA polymerase sigma factor [Algoriphagus sp.]HAS58611.1 sigma-70 family RNA polymerase sigma factor [Algoriphagus sp.]|tara:strand:+ start:63 stop:560 length:498 start_codon:yes stop_codon:yes gene_type:complete
MNKDQEFVQLIQENQGLIYKITTIYTRDREEQNDLYQEIVYQTWKSFDQFKKASKPSTWLYRVGMNTAITHLNQSKKKVTAVPLEGLRVEIADEKDPIKEEKITQLYAEIRKLNLLDRGIVFLYLEGKNHEEISEIVGISISNVGTRMSRIKQKLKQGVHSNKAY